MSVAKVKVTQNRHVCDQSEKKGCGLCSIHILYSFGSDRNIKIAVNSLCDFSNPKRGLL